MDDNDQQSLNLFCKLGALYRFVQISQANNPCFLQRCLSYNIQAKKNKRKNSGGEVIFNYMDHDNKCLESEVMEDFSCAFCLMRCGSHEGMKCHMTSSHDRFNYNFWLWENSQLQIAVSVRLEASTYGELKHDLEWRQSTFRSKGRKPSQRDDSSSTMKHIKLRFLELDLNELPRDDDTENGDITYC